MLRPLIVLNPFEPPQLPERMVWTSSSIKLFRRCKRKWFWKYVLRLRPRHYDKHLMIGSAFHNLLGHWYRGKRVSMASIVTAFQRKLEDEFIAQRAYYDQDDLDDLRMMIDSFTGMMLGYSTIYETDRAQWNIQRPSIEAQFKINFGDFDYAGKIDLIANKHLVEHKTASKISESYIDRLPLDTQIRGYILGARSLGFKFDSVLYDVVRKCKLRRKSNESLDDFSDRVAHDYVGRPDFYFYRENLRFDSSDLDALEYELRQTHAEYVALIPASALNPRGWMPNDSACFDFFRTCEFHKLCTTGLDKGTALTYEQGDTLNQELEHEVE